MAKEKQTRLTSFADLGAQFGLQLPASSVARTDTEDFYAKPILQRIRECDSTRGRAALSHDRRERRAATIGDILRMDRGERVKLGISVFAYGNLDSDGMLIAEDSALTSAEVMVLYPANFQGHFRVMDIRDDLLTEYDGISLDTVVEQIDELRQETPQASQNRLLMNIKSLDTLISRQKQKSGTQKYGLDYAPLQKQVRSRNVTQEMERLNRLKSIAVWDFLQTSLRVEEENPHLQPLFTVEGNEGGTHIAITMWSPADRNVLQQALLAYPEYWKIGKSRILPILVLNNYKKHLNGLLKNLVIASLTR